MKSWISPIAVALVVTVVDLTTSGSGWPLVIVAAACFAIGSIDQTERSLRRERS